MNEQGVKKQPVPTFYFIGVTTSKSSIMKVFPLWMQEMGYSDIVMEGVDLKIHGPDEDYRQAVRQIKYDPESLGALVTTHKIDLLNAARDMFGELDPYAELCGEVSSISKQNGRLVGHAKDPISCGASMDDLLGEGYFGRTGGHILCFGAGGSGISAALHMINKKNVEDRPKRFVVVNRSQGRLDHMQAMIDNLETDIEFEYIQNSEPNINDGIMHKLPPHSVVINATGMGKDTPGSPITDDGVFPRNGIAWDFNYRGELDFMHQALAQRIDRNLVVEDGWLYFLHGWTQVISEVLHHEIPPDLFGQLERVANVVRPPLADGLRR
ncbi:MAG: shikimate dehydrogenase [Chloroflexi bacterium]|nr:MAG: shikimate dehydrogenase [Chloroflexota bacterium]